jgi:hypothetical protein
MTTERLVMEVLGEGRGPLAGMEVDVISKLGSAKFYKFSTLSKFSKFYNV